MVGFKRAAFSNEAGIGSASIAHSAVRTENPASEGLVSLLEPFIDTVVVCTMTALVIIITGTWQNAEGLGGVGMTSSAFESVISWFPMILALAVILFAFSTMIAWSYYGDRSTAYIFGETAVPWYRMLYVICFIAAAIIDTTVIWNIAYVVVALVTIPNLFAMFLLRKEMREQVDNYVVEK